MGQYGALLGPVGPRWTPCWPHEPCYQGILAKYYMHTDPAAILKIIRHIPHQCSRLYMKHQHGNLPNYFHNFNLTTQVSHHSYDTRSSEQIRTDMTRAESYDNRIRAFLPKFINSTPANLVQKIATHSLQSFSNIKRCILNEYTEICSAVNCDICQRTRKNDNGQTFSTGFVCAKSTSILKCSIITGLFLLWRFCFVGALLVLFTGMKTPHLLCNIWQLVVSVRAAP